MCCTPTIGSSLAIAGWTAKCMLNRDSAGTEGQHETEGHAAIINLNDGTM